jgi:hypothetical protein
MNLYFLFTFGLHKPRSILALVHGSLLIRAPSIPKNKR